MTPRQHVDALCRSLAAGGYKDMIPGVRCATALGIPAVVRSARRTILVRYATLPSEGGPGSLVAELLLSGDARAVVATEAGATPQEGREVLHNRSIRMSDDMWRALSSTGDASAAVRAAVSAWLAERAK